MKDRDWMKSKDEGREEVISVMESTITLDSARRSPWLDPELRDRLNRADLILLPWPGFRDWSKPVFPEQTEELYRFLRDGAPDSVTVELALRDEDYVEVSLRHEFITLPEVVVTLIAAPVAVNLISDWLREFLRKRHDAAEVKFKMSIDMSDGSARSIEYEGPVKTFENLMQSQLRQLARGDDDVRD